MHPQYPFRLLLLLLCLIPHPFTISHQVASSPGLLEFPSIPFTPGVLRDTLVDSSSNLYAVGTSPTSAYVLKRSPTLQPLWSQPLPSLPSIPPAIVLTSHGSLFAIAPSPIPSTTSYVQIILYHLDTYSGSILRTAQVDQVRLHPSSTLRCILTSAVTGPTMVYITYLVQDGINPTLARTRLVQMLTFPSGHINMGWNRSLTSPSRHASSSAVAPDASNARILVAEISSHDPAASTDRFTLYSLNDHGRVLQNVSMNSASAFASVEALVADELGGIYVAEGPRLLYRVVVRNVAGENWLVKLWNVTDLEVADMTVLRNGTVLYVLSHADGVRNDGNQLVRTKNPILSAYNTTGERLFRSNFVEPILDAERQMYSLSLIDPTSKCHAILGGFVRLATNQGEEQISIGVFTFPTLFQTNDTSHNNSQTAAPIDTNSPNPGDQRSGAVLIIAGVGAGVAVLAIIGVSLFVVYRRGDGSDKNSKVSTEAEQPQPPRPVSSEREHTVLV